MQSQTKYLIRYFPIHARGEYVRMALTAGGCNWREEPVQIADWPNLKGKDGIRFLPIMSENGGAW